MPLEKSCADSGSRVKEAAREGVIVNRQEQQLILRLWSDWCRVWPDQYGHESLHVKPGGYDPVFDVIPSQTYKDFYFEVVRSHSKIRHLNIFEVVDAALNQIRAPEMTLRRGPMRADADRLGEVVPELMVEHLEPRIVEVELQPLQDAPPFKDAKVASSANSTGI